jgi:putative Holliday junction resolvase
MAETTSGSYLSLEYYVTYTNQIHLPKQGSSMRVLAVDFGLKRIGLAISEPRGTMALPYATLVKKDNSQLMDEIQAIVDKEGVECLVVGLPVGLNSEETLTTRQARNFAGRLGSMTSLPVYLEDERLSSSEAALRLKSMGLAGRKHKKVLDQIAATIILESFLASESVRDCQ